MNLFLASSPDLSTTQLQELLQLVGKDKAEKGLVITAGVVPYGLDPKPEWANRSIRLLSKITNVLEENSLEDGDRIPSDLSQYDFIFVTGGNVFYLAYRLEETGFGKRLREYVQNGGVYAGSSAGSAVLMNNLEHFAIADDPAKAPRMCKGLDLLDEAVVVHANHEKYAPIMKDVATKYEDDGLEVTRINDGKVLLIDGENRKII